MLREDRENLRPTDTSAAVGQDLVPDADKTIDREKTCPLLLRVFCNIGRHASPREYQRGNTPINELQIYTWLDATLKELSSLVREVNVDARQKGTYFDFGIVYPDPRAPVYAIREIGTTCVGLRGKDDNVTLASKDFDIGDYIDIAITPPHRSVGALPSSRFRPY